MTFMQRAPFASWSRRALGALAVALAACQAGERPREWSIKEWTSLEDWNERHKPVLVRPADAQGTGFMLRRDNPHVLLWQPTPRGGAVTWVEEARWRAGAGPVQECKPRLEPLELGREHPGEGALWKGRALRLAGTRLYKAALSHDGRWIALLSSSGESRSPVPFLGGGELPPYFLQFFDIRGERLSPKVYRVPAAGDWHVSRVCWSGDDRYLVALSPTLDQLVVVQPGLDKRSP